MPPRKAPQPARRPRPAALPGLRLKAGRRGSRLGQALAAGTAGGAVTSLAFPPVDAGFLAFAGLLPLALAVRALPAAAVAAASAAFGAIFFGLLLSWIRLFGLPAYAGLILTQTAWVLVAMLAARLVCGILPGGWKVLAFPLAFVAGEYLRSHLPLGGFAWGGIGYSQHGDPAALRLASYTGVWGLTLVVAGASALVGEGVLAARAAPGRAALWALGAAALVLLPRALPVHDADGEAAVVAMVQGNVPEHVDDPHADDLEVLQNHIALSRSLPATRPSLVVWPEGSVERDPFSDPQFSQPLTETVRAVGAPFLVGATLDGPGGRFFNSSLFFRPDGSLAGRYDKMHLVPYGEYVPGRRILEPLVKELERVPRDGIAGGTPTVFEIREGRFASVICYEVIFPDLVRRFVAAGARFLVVSTNNSSFARTPASAQHVAFSQVRAAEHRMWVAHAALSGISAVVDPSGRVVRSTGLFEPALLTPEIRFSTRTTVYGRYGDWPPVSATVAVWIMSLASIRAGRGRRRAAVPASRPAATGGAAGEAS